MTGQLTNLLSFRRIADTPFDTYMATLDSWQLTRHDGELRLGNSLLRGPIERDRHFGTCRIQVRLARRPLRAFLVEGISGADNFVDGRLHGFLFRCWRWCGY